MMLSQPTYAHASEKVGNETGFSFVWGIVKASFGPLLTASAGAAAGCFAGKSLTGCAVGGAAGLLLGAKFVQAADAQGQRIANYDKLPTTFSGVAGDGESDVTYSGTRVGAFLQGSYGGEDGAGSFKGALQRNGTVSGQYSEGAERGVFSGTITPNLDRVLGSSICTSGCDE